MNILMILLGILKVIGFILVGILLLLLMVLILVLFVPVRYQLEGSYREQFHIHLKITWLLHAISFVYEHNNENKSMKVKFLGIPLDFFQKRRLRKPKTKRHKKENRKKDNQKQGTLNHTSLNKSNQDNVKVTKPQNSDQTREDESNGDTPEYVSPKNVQTKVNPLDNQRKKESEVNKVHEKRTSKQNDLRYKIKTFFSHVKIVINKIIQQFINIKYTFQKMYAKIVDIKNNISFYITVLQNDETKAVLHLLKKDLARVLKNLKPKKLQCKVKLGKENDPEFVGKITALWSMGYAIFGQQFQLTPDFTKNIFEIEGKVKGKITVYVYGLILYHYLFNNHVKQFKSILSNREQF